MSIEADEGSSPVKGGTRSKERPSWRLLALCLGLGSVVFALVFVPTYLAFSAHIDKRPSFIVLLVDDLGYDDIALHHPPGLVRQYLKTPNLDRMLHSGLGFSNWYTTPMCSTSRAELLSGRWYPRTGSMYINTGWDFINVNETLMPRVLADAGYATAVAGKWHNGRTPGYTPADAGFKDTFLPSPYVFKDNVMSINGMERQTRGWMEGALMTEALGWLRRRESDRRPFLLYYPSFSVHAGWEDTNNRTGAARYQRPAPHHFRDALQGTPLSPDTASLYAMLAYFDQQLGRLLDFLESSPLGQNTYVLLSGDNGPALFSHESKELPRAVRMPSGMQGSKHDVLEGGIRNILAVRGPGVPEGSTTNALLGLVDVLPTLAELAGVSPQTTAPLQWDGISFANLLRGQPMTTAQQERMIFSMSTHCVEEDFVPELGPDRRPLKPQALLDYATGGASGLGFRRCVAVRQGPYKWLADASVTRGSGPAMLVGRERVPSALYNFSDGRHIELPFQEVSQQVPLVAARMAAAAEAWFADMVASPHSFNKPVFFLGIHNRGGVNIVGDGAIERTPGRVRILPMGVAGFQRSGDAAFYRLQVLEAGKYEVSLFYQAHRTASFRIWAGPYSAIVARDALHLDMQLARTTGKREKHVAGVVSLPRTSAADGWEICFELTSVSDGAVNPGAQANGTNSTDDVIAALDTMYFRRVDTDATGTAGQVYDPDKQEGVRDWKAAHGLQGRR